jgi:putative chitinase
LLHQPKAFFDHLRATVLGPDLSADEVNGCNAILTAMEGLPLAYVAYALATAYHETAHTMQPVKERGGTGYFTRMYDIMGQRPDVAKRLGNMQPGDGATFCGRGYVQITGRHNYAKASEKLGLDCVRFPDIALHPAAAAFIMREGMLGGWFTGVTLASELPEHEPACMGSFVNARRIINGVDRAQLIAGYAMQFQKALQLGAWLVAE